MPAPTSCNTLKGVAKQEGNMRRHKRSSTMLTTLVLLATVFVAPAAATPAMVPGLPVYLALGDSWAYGQGATDPTSGGYVAQLDEVFQVELDCVPGKSDKAADGCKHLQLLNLARAATETLPGVTTPLVASEQLPVALPLLEARNQDANPRNNVEVITLHVGGNDVSG